MLRDMWYVMRDKRGFCFQLQLIFSKFDMIGMNKGKEQYANKKL